VSVQPEQLDVTDPESVERLAGRLEVDPGRLDVLVNNAGVQGEVATNAATAPLDDVHETMETNLFGAWRLTQALLPLLRTSPRARIVNVSSGAGQLSDMTGGYPGYRISKTALNALTRVLANEETGILTNSMCPAGSGRTWEDRQRRAPWRRGRTQRYGWRSFRTTGRVAGSFATVSRFPGELRYRVVTFLMT
jgi:NAD(P)-dependent dehydrogenase (short-subunit alcohol dehydrogenase family)